MVKKLIFFCFIIFISPGLVMGELIDNGDGTITDTDTGLMWSQTTHSAQHDWEGAILSCEAIASSTGFDDWRLPSKNELLSIVDYTKYNPAASDKFATNAGYYWTSTSYVKVSDPPEAKAWCINFKNGMVEGKAKTEEEYYVRAVRGGQNQLTGMVISEPAQTSDWMIGRLMPIIWEGAGKANVNIILSDDGGSSFDKVIVENTPDDGSYVWRKIGTADNGEAMNLGESDNYVLKVELTDGSAGNIQGMFSIKEETGGFGSKTELSDIIRGLQILAGILVE
ncbi:DUF1566 domain-containing protein [Desulfonema magnum]|uniref:DUF1566 n=1 Tax=Desulfonema magnum TaxID=45655 RepID=A0A975BEP1_9BACT|nr:DUF1566 domain-containing protein [Desulfonema magnum]QTA84334.1 DUF1566 [Desulfonema magnum]